MLEYCCRNTRTAITVSANTQLELIESLIQQNRDGALVTDDQGRIVTHNSALVELLQQPAGVRFDTTLRLGPVNLQRLLIRAAIAAGEQDAVGRPRPRALDFRAELDVRDPPIPVRITSLPLPQPDGERRLHLVTVQPDSRTPTPTADPTGCTPESLLESRDPECRERLDFARRAVDSGVRLLLVGETGTGKTLLARSLHDSTRRRAGPFVEIHCASLPEIALESELFGHVRGAFPGATADRVGRIEAADGGTLLLDDVGAMPDRLRSALERVLGDGRFERVGESRARHVDLQVIATSSQDLRRQVDAGRFQPALYYRLAEWTVVLPPLRERPRDLEATLERWSRHHGIALSRRAHQRLRQHPWPGNFRELRHVLAALRLRATPTDGMDGIDEAMVAAALARPDGPTDAGLAVPLPRGTASPLPFTTAEERERETLQAALAAHQGNRSKAARSLSMDRTTLWRKLHRLRLIPERTRG